MLEQLEPFRAARLVFDFELIEQGIVPMPWLARAIATGRRLGARALADRLEAERTGPWQALGNYLRRGPDEADSLAELFVSAGYPGVRLSRRESGDDGAEEVLVAGAGGAEELSAPLGRGLAVLAAPVVDEVLRTLFRLILRDLEPAPAHSQTVGRRSPGIVGESAALTSALERASRFAPETMPVLILGETGTGKELVAREIHRHSRIRGRPFLAVNCAALSESLLLSDLFGHARGAFTGADRERAGVFESARGGTVFLDEIGDLPATAQGALLRVLQEGEIRRVGEAHVRKVDVRVITATHRDLRGMVEEGSFRADLYYRLKVATIELPALRDRGLDVLVLAEAFLASRAEVQGSTPTLSDAARQHLLSHSWPGNIRELRSTLEAACALCGEALAIEVDHLDLPPRETPSSSYHALVEAYRRSLVEEALQAASGNRAAAARRLGLSRQALSYLVRQLGIA